MKKTCPQSQEHSVEKKLKIKKIKIKKMHYLLDAFEKRRF